MLPWWSSNCPNLVITNMPFIRLKVCKRKIPRESKVLICVLKLFATLGSNCRICILLFGIQRWNVISFVLQLHTATKRKDNDITTTRLHQWACFTVTQRQQKKEWYTIWVRIRPTSWYYDYSFNSASFLFIVVISLSIGNKFLPMTGFEPQISSFGIDHCATTTVHSTTSFIQQIVIDGSNFRCSDISCQSINVPFWTLL